MPALAFFGLLEPVPYRPTETHDELGLAALLAAIAAVAALAWWQRNRRR